MSKLIRPFHTWSIAQQPHTAPHHQQGPGQAGCSLGEQGMELTKAEQAGRAEMAAAAMQSSSPNPAKLLPLGAIQESLLLYSRKQHTACFCTVLHLPSSKNVQQGVPSAHLPLLANGGSEQFHTAQEALVQHKCCSDFPPTP